MSLRSRLAATLSLAGAATIALPLSVAAQSGFLFKPPIGSFSIRAGYSVPRAGSEIFDFTTEQLTIDRSDFNTVTVGGDVAFRVTDRFDIALGAGIARSEKRSEFRDYIGEDDLPIEQETRLTRVPVTASVRAYLSDRGRRISRFAWVPSKWSPYLGAGGGWMWYRFEQEGEFVDFVDLSIFRETFESSGWTPTAHVFGGAEVSLGPRFVLTGEARYGWASAEMQRDFVDFDKIDLAGFQATVGVAVRF